MCEARWCAANVTPKLQMYSPGPQSQRLRPFGQTVFALSSMSSGGASRFTFAQAENCQLVGTSCQKMSAVGFEPTPLRTGTLSQRLRPLGQTVLLRFCLNSCGHNRNTCTPRHTHTHLNAANTTASSSHNHQPRFAPGAHRWQRCNLPPQNWFPMHDV